MLRDLNFWSRTESNIKRAPLVTFSVFVVRHCMWPGIRYQTFEMLHDGAHTIGEGDLIGFTSGFWTILPHLSIYVCLNNIFRQKVDVYFVQHNFTIPTYAELGTRCGVPRFTGALSCVWYPESGTTYCLVASRYINWENPHWHEKVVTKMRSPKPWLFPLRVDSPVDSAKTWLLTVRITNYYWEKVTHSKYKLKITHNQKRIKEPHGLLLLLVVTWKQFLKEKQSVSVFI